MTPVRVTSGIQFVISLRNTYKTIKPLDGQADTEMSEIDGPEQVQADSSNTGQSAAESEQNGATLVHVDGPSHLEELTASRDVVLADFYADWCGPCKMLEPILEDVSADTGVTIAKVDVDRHQELAAQYRVQGVPTMVLFADGDVAEQLVGVRDRDTLKRLVERHDPN